MSDTTTAPQNPALAESDSELERSITGRLLFFYVLGDVLGSGIYVLIGLSTLRPREPLSTSTGRSRTRR